MPEVLQYHGRQMKPTPLNMELHEVRSILESGKSVRIRLEPGDGTRYDLLITPQSDPDLRFTGCNEHHFLVTKVTGGECISAFVSRWSDVHQWIPFGNRNLWTSEFLNWWWSVLWAGK